MVTRGRPTAEYLYRWITGAAWGRCCPASRPSCDRDVRKTQWIQFEGCTKGDTDTLSVRTAAEVGCKAHAGDRLLVKVKATDGTVAEGFNVLLVVEADAPPIQWAHKATWTKVVPRRPQGGTFV